MSYLDDPRVFLATERTLLAWIRTEISILAIAFILKKFGIEDAADNQGQLTLFIIILCTITVILAILSFIQSWVSISKLSEREIPGPLAKPIVLLAGLVSILISFGATYIVMSF
ncbi:YidH family protein [Methyloprofundus sp.]|uniref:YidH family protein n=1 Tax=Methyloprofundus sp. TaxID=2020875 RepID=UPI003D110DFD